MGESDIRVGQGEQRARTHLMLAEFSWLVSGIYLQGPDLFSSNPCHGSPDTSSWPVGTEQRVSDTMIEPDTICLVLDLIAPMVTQSLHHKHHPI